MVVYGFVVQMKISSERLKLVPVALQLIKNHFSNFHIRDLSADLTVMNRPRFIMVLETNLSIPGSPILGFSHGGQSI